MRRRDFISLLGGAVTAPSIACAQEPGRTHRLAFFVPAARSAPAVAAFFDELRINGFSDGQNLTVLPGGFDIQRDQIADKAAALIEAKPDLIISGPDIYTATLQRLTSTIPLMTMSEDMITEALVPSLSRPGGNTTGISIMSPELNGKRQDLLIEATPGAKRIAALSDKTVPRPNQLEVLKNAARGRGIDLLVFEVARQEDLIPAINTAKAAGAQALNFLASSLFFPPRPGDLDRITAAGLPAIYHWPEAAELGGLIGYGPRFTELFRQRARQTVKVLRGIKPADIPVEQPTKFELVINLKAAKAIGHEIPASLVLRADKLIE